jgi:phage tail protein X
MSRYTDTGIFRTIKGREYYGTTKYPAPPLSSNDLYVITQEGDRFDQLAQQYYGDSSLWWVISTSNPGLKQNSYYPPVGVQIRIPTDLAAIMAQQQVINAR